jgi:hypothetical protein
LLDQLVGSVWAGESRVLVVRGDPGVGKTALLDYLAGKATGVAGLVTGVAGLRLEADAVLDLWRGLQAAITSPGRATAGQPASRRFGSNLSPPTWLTPRRRHRCSETSTRSAAVSYRRRYQSAALSGPPTSPRSPSTS